MINQNQDQPCPNCGYCPHCRRPQPFYPYQVPYNLPTYRIPYYGSGNTPVGYITYVSNTQ